ncbi:DMT family transporter [Clostridium sp. D2Q-11]|uniref:DMT family transporter n=1 Tax=Anaeromonas frigoriresistens TaxID=2683708 RepID=A0A942Z915_9FIRM|nr:DMT family transporter [Anaeromonas frigoriresistens]MBS4538853.1 DMT family transporter [Anaeromonas frigoriresistens]
MYKLSASFIGILIALMVTFNGILAKKTGDYVSILMIHIIGLIAISLILIIKNKRINLKKDIPIYFFSGGAIGVIMIFFNNISFNNLGVSLTLSLGLFGQSITAVIIDHFGLLGMSKHTFNKKKTTGFILIFIGIFIMIIGG